MFQLTSRITALVWIVLGACSSAERGDQPLMAAGAGGIPATVQPTPVPGVGGQSGGTSTTPTAGGVAGSRAIGAAGSTPAAGAGAGAAQAVAGGTMAGVGGMQAGGSGMTAAGTSGTGGMGAAGSSGTGGTATPPMVACQKGTTKASEVIFMGDSFITDSWGEIPQNIERLAREAGSLGANESYRMCAVPAAAMASIVTQFDQALRAGPVKVVIMDGAGIDVVLAGACSTESACAPIIGQFRDLWQHMGEEGVEWVVYLSYANLVGDDASNRRHDVLRAGVTEVCKASMKPKCVLHDQRPTWDPHPEYYADALHASPEGSRVTGTEIWKLMVQNCIAQ